MYNQDNGIVKAFRNIPGIHLLPVDHLNLLKVAPGGHLGRLIIWTESAFRKLDLIYGTETRKAIAKAKFNMPTAKMTNADFSRLIRSEEIVRAVRQRKKSTIKVKASKVHRNPLKKSAIMVKLNPYAAVLKRTAILTNRRQLGTQHPFEKKIQVMVSSICKGLYAIH